MVTDGRRREVKKERANITLDARINEAMSDEAWKRRKNKSQFINEILTQWLEAHTSSPITASGSQ